MADKTVYAVVKIRPDGKLVPVAICEIEATAVRLAARAPAQLSSVEVVINERPNGTLIGPVVLTRPSKQDIIDQAAIDAAEDVQTAADLAIAKALAAGLTQAEVDAIAALGDV